MIEASRAKAEPGAQQNWEVCDRAGVNILVLYALSAQAALGAASRLLAMPPEQLRAKALASHAPAREPDRPHAAATAWGDPE